MILSLNFCDNRFTGRLSWHKKIFLCDNPWWTTNVLMLFDEASIPFLQPGVKQIFIFDASIYNPNKVHSTSHNFFVISSSVNISLFRYIKGLHIFPTISVLVHWSAKLSRYSKSRSRRRRTGSPGLIYERYTDEKILRNFLKNHITSNCRLITPLTEKWH